MSLTLAFIMDPIEKVVTDTDTSFALMLAAQSRGHRIIHVSPEQVAIHYGSVFLRGREIQVYRNVDCHFKVITPIRVAAAECAAVFIRTDPPFDAHYLALTWILSFAENAGVRVINSPQGLRTASEHLFGLHFPQFSPETIVTSSRNEIHHFVEKAGGHAIAKPIDGHGGFGVVRLSSRDTNMNALIDLLTLEGKTAIIVQEFLGEAGRGDKRLFLIDGEIRAALRRVPAQGDHRGNIHVGGTPELCEIDADDIEIANALRPILRKEGLFFVGLDVIGGQLLEVNVTSPTLVQELKRLGGPDLATEIVAAVERA